MTPSTNAHRLLDLMGLVPYRDSYENTYFKSSPLAFIMNAETMPIIMSSERIPYIPEHVTGNDDLSYPMVFGIPCVYASIIPVGLVGIMTVLRAEEVRDKLPRIEECAMFVNELIKISKNTHIFTSSGYNWVRLENVKLAKYRWAEATTLIEDISLRMKPASYCFTMSLFTAQSLELMNNARSWINLNERSFLMQKMIINENMPDNIIAIGDYTTLMAWIAKQPSSFSENFAATVNNFRVPSGFFICFGEIFLALPVDDKS